MTYEIIQGDCRETLAALPDGVFNTCVTSPPYFGLRDYGVDGQMGMEQTPDEYVDGMVRVFREVRRVLRDDGTLWLNLGDSYANDGKSGGSTGGKHAQGVHGISGPGRAKRSTGLKPKDLIGIPWRVAFALQADGWYLRQDIIWHKPNVMPESVRDRCTKAHEYIFLLSKSERYYFDSDAIRDRSSSWKPEYANRKSRGSNITGNMSDRGVPRTTEGLNLKPAHEKTSEFRRRRSVWTVPTRPFKGAHFAAFPPDLIEPCILAGAPAGGLVLDPFGGAGTTALVAERNGRDSILLELNPEYVELAHARIAAG